MLVFIDSQSAELDDGRNTITMYLCVQVLRGTYKAETGKLVAAKAVVEELS